MLTVDYDIIIVTDVSKYLKSFLTKPKGHVFFVIDPIALLSLVTCISKYSKCFLT